ncbi:MAG: hypothetical protein SGJ27_11970 [Candidatus Melainabacteria bacterium]|nr:hypothetical protein [Candidatus Melainabacteria bacterium]
MHDGHQNQSGDHGHLKGGLPVDSPSSLTNWSAAMSGRQDKQWLSTLNANKMPLLAVAGVAVVLVLWLFFIDYSNKSDRAERSSNRQPNAESSKGAPSQLSEQSEIPSRFGVPRAPYDSGSNTQSSINQASFGTPAYSQPITARYASSGSPAPSQSFGAPATHFGEPQQNRPFKAHKPQPYRMTVTR